MSETGDMGNMNGEGRSRLEQRAEAVRSRLSRRLDELEERREHMVDLAKKVTRPPVSVVLLGTAAVVGAVIVARHLRARRASPSRRFGATFLGAPAEKPDGFLAKAFKRAALSFVATLVQRVSARGLDRLLPEAPLEAPPEVPRPRAY